MRRSIQRNSDTTCSEAACGKTFSEKLLKKDCHICNRGFCCSCFNKHKECSSVANSFKLFVEPTVSLKNKRPGGPQVSESQPESSKPETINDSQAETISSCCHVDDAASHDLRCPDLLVDVTATTASSGVDSASECAWIEKRFNQITELALAESLALAVGLAKVAVPVASHGSLDSEVQIKPQAATTTRSGDSDSESTVTVTATASGILAQPQAVASTDGILTTQDTPGTASGSLRVTLPVPVIATRIAGDRDGVLSSGLAPSVDSVTIAAVIDTTVSAQAPVTIRSASGDSESTDILTQPQAAASTDGILTPQDAPGTASGSLRVTVTLPVPVVPVVTIAGDDVMSSEPAPSGDSVTVAAAIDTTVSANKPQAAEARDLVIVIQDDQESVTARVKASATDRTIETPIIIDSEPESITANTSIPVVRYYDKAPPHRHFLSATPQGNKKQAYQTVVFESKKHGTQKIFAGMRREKSDYVFICAMKAPIDQDPSSTLATRNKEPGDQSDSNCEEGHCQGFIWQYIYVNYEDMDPFVSLSDEDFKTAELQFVMSPNPELESDLPFDNTFGLSEEDIRGPSVFLDRLYAAMARHALSSFRKRDSLVARGPRRNKTMQELEDDFVASGKQDEEEVGDSEGDSDIEIISKGPSSEINNGRVLKEIIELSAASGTGTSTGTGTGTGTGKSKKTHRNTSSTSSNPPVPPRPTGLRGNTKRSFYDPSADSSSKRKTPKKTDVDSDEGSDTGKQPPVLPPWKKPDPTLSDSSSSEENEPDVELPVQTKTKKAAKPKTPKGPLTGHDENVSTGMATEREKALNKELNELRQQMQQQMEQQLQHQLQMQQQLQQLHQQTHPQLIVPAATAKTAATAAATTAAAATAERVAAAEAKVAAETAAKLQKQQEDQHDQFMRMKSQQSTLAVSLGLPLLGSGAAATEGTVTEKLDLSFAGVFESFTAQLGRANKALSKVVQDDINNRTVTTMADLRGKRTIKSFSQQTEHVTKARDNAFTRIQRIEDFKVKQKAKRMYGEYAGIHYDDEDNEEEFKWESGENEDSGDRDN